MVSDASPREIVAGLHAEIAAKSPEHAALVAAFEAGWLQVPPVPPASIVKQPRIERLRPYAAMRARGVNREEAARAAGVTAKTAQNYDSGIRHGWLPAPEVAP